jgi:hypothetical protein
LKHIVEDLLMLKCHPEIAERGVEYAWVYSKLHFQTHFNNVVPKYLLQENIGKALNTEVLTLNCMRKFAQKAQGSKLTYTFLIHKVGGNDASAANDDIEHLTKMFKVHQLAMDAKFSSLQTLDHV